MKISFHKVELKKRFPLAISRGIRYHSENIFVRFEKDGLIGWGEAAPGDTEGASTPEAVQQALEEFVATGIEGYSIQALYDRAREMKIPPCAYVGLDIALWDWTAKKSTNAALSVARLSKGTYTNLRNHRNQSTRGSKRTHTSYYGRLINKVS